MIVASIIVCTHDRAADCIDCVSELRRQTDEAGEIIVVDSASGPAAATALAELASGGGEAIRLLRLDVGGLSRARNAGLAAARGAWVVFLDDDTVPLQGWYARLVESLADAPPDRAAIGGAAIAQFPSGFEGRRLTPRHKECLSVVDGAEAGSVRDGRRIVGANLALRRDKLISIGGFDERLGRIGSSLLSGDESAVIRQFLARGWDVWYDPRVAVRHKIPAERLHLRWLARRTFMEGVTEVRLHRESGSVPRHIRPFKLAISIPVLAVAAAALFWRSGPTLRLARAAGGLREHLARPKM